MSKVSILIPAHNNADTLASTLAPLVGEGFDIIVIAHGCSDTTAAIARKIAPAAFVLESPVEGRARALNLGLLASYGDYIVCLDPDVMVTARAVRNLVMHLSQTGLDLAYGPISFEWSGASAVIRGFYEAWKRDQYFGAAAAEGCFALKREALEQAGGFEFEAQENCWVTHKFMGRAVYVPTAIYRLRAPLSLPSLAELKSGKLSAKSRSSVVQGRPFLSAERGPVCEQLPIWGHLRRDVKAWAGAAVFYGFRFYIRLMNLAPV